MLFTFAKTTVAAVWLLILMNFLVDFGQPWKHLLYWTGAGFVGAHLLEMAYFFPRVRSAKLNQYQHAFMLFIFGAFHGLQLPKK